MDIILVIMCLILVIGLIKYISSKTKPMEDLTVDVSNQSPQYMGEDDRKDSMFDL